MPTAPLEVYPKTLCISSPGITKYAWVILVVVYFAGVVAPFNQFKVPPIMPLLMAGFHLDLTQAGFMMSIMAAIGWVLAIPASIALQRFGPKNTILVALAFLACGALLGAGGYCRGVQPGSSGGSIIGLAGCLVEIR